MESTAAPILVSESLPSITAEQAKAIFAPEPRDAHRALDIEPLGGVGSIMWR